ncbi:propionate catabolism operon regulatory protein PrpR [Peristeroidobacter soli]|uniref:propionate catabolism operon regulatory protein PrpR n=1 Tax=Peristeroidobacter soli TaxID=2497877 RepID=UPI00101D3F5E|nr:propionate catabolism operon regulatory protein PrpR [Peristeroidobacter soli]
MAMNAQVARPNDPLRIVAVGLHRLKDLFRDLAPTYAQVARVEVLDSGFETAVDTINELSRQQPIDVLVAAGSNGAYLRQHIELPVVLVRVGGFDILSALGRARSISSRIALVTHGALPVELERFNELFGLGIEQRSYRTTDEARNCVLELRARGIEVVVAPGLIADLAEAAGMASVFLYSEDAVREALDDAVEMARLSHMEGAKRERLNTIIGQLRDGVVAVDMDERIEILNPAMARLLERPASDLIGHKLSDIAPELSLARTLREPRTEIDELQKIGTRAVLTSRLPITEQGAQTGAVLTAQDPESIQRVDRDLRARRHKPAANVRYRLTDLVGTSAGIVHTRSLAAQYARSDATVLVFGESGTGKELLAQGIHAASKRANQPFIAINCGAFPESLLESELFGYEEGAFTGARRGGKLGLFEAAHTGTIFLDEIGEMPVSLQTRLLRVLQEKEILRVGAIEPTRVDVRVIAATHRDLTERIGTGDFRRDLYYRLNILRLELPGLRDRRQDLPELVAHLARKIATRTGIDITHDSRVQKLLDAAWNYEWPGNVRELENLLERVAMLATPNDAALSDMQLRELMPEISAPAPGKVTSSIAAHRAESEIDLIRRVLEESDGSYAKASERLGISRTTLWRKLKKERSV